MPLSSIETSKNKVFSNLVWRFAERCGAQIVAFIVSIVLARVLDPDTYGIVALINVFTTIFQVFVDSGLGNALIQKKEVDNTDFSTVFFANIIFCITLYGILFIISPLIAKFYDNLSITAYMRVLGLTILISGIKNVQQAYVSRNMLFKKFFFSTLGGTVIAGITGVIMGLTGFGVWALVTQQVVNLTIDTIILWVTVKWRPEKIFSVERLKELFSYGYKLLISSLIDIFYRETRSLLIGKIYTSYDLAYYNQGDKFPNVIINNINTSIDSVLLPTLSNQQDNAECMKNMTRRAIKTSTYIMAPLMMGLAFTADSVVSLLLTDKWLPCVIYLRIFCVTYMSYPIHTANLNAIKAMGRSDLFLKLEIWKKIIGVVALIGTIWISVEAMAYSLLFMSVCSQIINSWPNKKLLNYGYRQQLKDILPEIILAVIMGACIYPIKFIPMPVILTLIVQIVTGGGIYVIGSVIFKLDSFQYLVDVIKSILKSKKR